MRTAASEPSGARPHEYGDPVSQPDPQRRPPGPPGRPRFEFRQRPSEVVTRRARSVDVSAGLWTAAAVLGLVAALVMLLDLDGTQAAVRAIVDRDLPDESAVTRDRAVTAAAAVLIGGAFVVSLATGVSAAAMRSGRGGARFVLVLLLVVTVVEIVLAVGVVAPVVLVVLVVAAALGVAAAVPMYLPGANRWFAIRRR